jgi:peptide/nickel transport system permease protein
MFMAAFFAPLIAPFDPARMMADYPFMGTPNGKYLLGTDPIGRDNLSRLIYAARTSLAIGVLATAINVLLGGSFGLLSGYYGGWVDMIIMRLGDMIMSFPHTLLIMVVASTMGSGILPLTIIMGFVACPRTARIVRGCVLSEKKMTYVMAGVALGFSNPRIMLSHIFPNIAAPLIVESTFNIARNMITEASLSFLGIGVQPPLASWGNMLNNTQSMTVLLNKPFLWLPPGLAIMLSVLSFNFLGDGLRDAFDPKNNTH